ncbi:hypothetical protein ACEQ8H_008935 [Pleosporales sp. CAS-2024a]
MPALYEQFFLFGDSITQDSYDQSRGFGFSAALQHGNTLVSGYNTRQALQVLPAIIPSPEQAKIRFLVVFFGANDASLPDAPNKQHIALDEYKSNLEKIATHPAIAAHSPCIIMVAPPPINEHLWWPRDQASGYPSVTRLASATKTYADAACEVGAKLDIPVVNLWRALMDKADFQLDAWNMGETLPGSLDIPQNDALAELMYDGNPAAYDILFQELMKLLEPLSPCVAIPRPTASDARTLISALIALYPLRETLSELIAHQDPYIWGKKAGPGPGRVHATGEASASYPAHRDNSTWITNREPSVGGGAGTGGAGARHWKGEDTGSREASLLSLPSRDERRLGMDPQSVAFQPRDEFWRFQDEMLRVQQSQAELSDRVSRLERQRDDDSRLKNVWGTSSPFPSVLGGTPQQVPLQQPTAEHFSSFDDHPNNLIGNLQLDADEEPRRVGATSRANSVRFDETANHGHWAHASRSSLDLIPRTGSGLGGIAMSERSYSHKSDGRQSSAGHSVHSMTSGRANSLTGLGPAALMEPPGLAPGLFILGSVPAIIRCWLDTTFKHDTLLYAAVCSGAYTSSVDVRLIEQLGLQHQMTKMDDGSRKIKMAVYLPEAVPMTASSRSSSPAPQLPCVGVDFAVEEGGFTGGSAKAIQIFLGSDVLRAHNADLLFSTNQLTLYDDDACKLQIPLVRPEDERTFKSLAMCNRWVVDMASRACTEAAEAAEAAELVRCKSSVDDDHGAVAQGPRPHASKLDGSDDGGSTGRPRLGVSASASTRSSGHEGADAAAMVGSWRRESSEKGSTGTLDWASVGKTATATTGSKPRDTGMKVLRPSRAGTRTLAASVSSAAAATSQSRFFDDGKRRGEHDAAGAPPQLKGNAAGDKGVESAGAGAGAAPGKARAANPVGGASAFAWLHSGR